jgi:hypothetical protein
VSKTGHEYNRNPPLPKYPSIKGIQTVKQCKISYHKLKPLEAEIQMKHVSLTGKCQLLCSYSVPYFLYWSHDFMISRISTQRCPPRNSIGRQSHVGQARFQLLCFATVSPDDSSQLEFTLSATSLRLSTLPRLEFG